MPNSEFEFSKEKPKSFEFNHLSNFWLKRPFYFFLILFLVVIIGGSYLYYYNLNNQQNSIITENVSPKNQVSSKVSGVEEMKELDKFDGLVNILLLGNGGPNHAGGGLTDVIQVLSVNTSNNQAFLFSLPRDLYVNIDGFGYHKINTAYNLGQQTSHGQGGVLAKKEVEQVTGIPMHYYIRVNFDGFKEIVNILGGLDICVDKAINDTKGKIYISTGCQQMDGEQALAYSRSRYTTSDFDRSRRQQKIMFAIKDKLLGLNFLLNPLKINQAFTVLTGNFNTDIKISEFKKIGEMLSGLNQSQIDSYVLDNRKDNLLYSTSKHGSYVLLPVGGDFSKIKKFIDQKIENNLIN